MDDGGEAEIHGFFCATALWDRGLPIPEQMCWNLEIRFINIKSNIINFFKTIYLFL